jgi:hypothetical protein
VEAAGDDADGGVRDRVDQAVLAVDAAGPGAGELVLERLGLAEALERIALDGLDELDDAESGLTVFGDPPARSSKAAGSNSKLFTDGLEGDALLALEGGEQALAHRFALEQVGRLLLGDDVPPEVDGDDDSGGLALFVRDVLDVDRSGQGWDPRLASVDCSRSGRGARSGRRQGDRDARDDGRWPEI